MEFFMSKIARVRRGMIEHLLKRRKTHIRNEPLSRKRILSASP
jgi:hypothetical protein